MGMRPQHYPNRQNPCHIKAFSAVDWGIDNLSLSIHMIISEQAGVCSLSKEPIERPALLIALGRSSSFYASFGFHILRYIIYLLRPASIVPGQPSRSGLSLHIRCKRRGHLCR